MTFMPTPGGAHQESAELPGKLAGINVAQASSLVTGRTRNFGKRRLPRLTSMATTANASITLELASGSATWAET
jgi:hypothetical protein